MNTPDSPQPDGVDASKEQQLWRIFFWSFFLSQGYASLQQNLIAYAKEQNPDLRVTDEDPDQMQSIFEKRLRAFIPKTIDKEGAHFAIEEDAEIAESTRSALNRMHVVFHKPSTKDPSRLLASILEDMLERDRDFLRLKVHRPGKKSEGQGSILTDPWLSHVEYFLVEGHSINVPEYDALFEELRPIANKLLEDPQSTFRKDYDEMLYVRNANRKSLEDAQ